MPRARRQRRIERSVMAIAQYLKGGDSAGEIQLDDRILHVTKRAMVDAAVDRLLKGDGKTSRIIREVFESYRDRPGAYDSYASFERQVFRFWEKY